jgi:hypothetical protein
VQPLFPVFLSIDPLAAALAISLAVAVSLGTGFVPAWLVLRRTATGQLKESAQSGGITHSRLRASLVIAQVALSLTLFVLTGLFARTVQVMAAATPAALKEQLVMTFDPAILQLSAVDARAFAVNVAARAASDPRSRSVALSVDDGARWRVVGTETQRTTPMIAITPAWLDVMGGKLVTGRPLTEADDESSVLVNERAAGQVAPEGHALGALLTIEDANGSSTPRLVRVVGVVSNIRRYPTDEHPDPLLYVPFPREISRPFALRVRTTDPDALRADLAQMVSGIDPRIAWTSISRGDRVFEGETGEMSFTLYIVGFAGVIALLLSATGLYAVMSYVVTLRRREIGVRLAIGASPSRVVGLVLQQSMRLVAIGVAAGVALAVPTAFAMRAAFVSNVSPIDPLVLAPTVTLLLVVGAIASALPAFRASRVDPIATLRQD